ncbi:LPS assembly protein LptD [Thalassotalea sp. PLHSN55]|uniref:LPS assembly protein LptD n=1 Tax=Thalassotalea sp. PLHSN55 TaxID=3435888 RepID=UPI003F82EB3A
MTFSRFILLLVASISTVLPAHAENEISTPSTIECPIPKYTPIAEDAEIEASNDIKILSKTAMIEKEQLALFTGGVTLINKNEKLIADELEINQAQAIIKAKGDVHFQNAGIDVSAQEFQASEQSKSTTLENTSYQLANNPGHGAAERIAINADGELTLSASTFTTCYGEIPDWQLKASEIRISAAENVGEAYNAQFRLFDVPVLYIPYFTFPVTDQRKSGFLNPKIGSSSNSGIEIETPYYWNIAENMDATITPHYMSKRGLLLATEFRYLSDLQTGSIDIEYLNKDKEIVSNNDARYLARFQHTGTFSENFRVYADFTTISDDNYLTDIGSSHYNANDAYLYQIGELSYFGENWQTTAKVQDFEVLGDHIAGYRTVPQIDVSAEQNLPFANLIFDVYSELSRFESENPDLADANRYHVEAGLTLPLATPAWFVNSEVRLMQTYYQQDVQDNTPSLEENVSRTLPKVRVHGGINFDRQMSFNPEYTQTFEPQLQYLYVPNEDQSMIGLYDTAQLQDDYDGLFRDRRYSGLDRIAHANQLSWGVTNRILDPSHQELMRFSLGQILYFNEETTEDNRVISQTQESALAADVFFQLNRQWQFSGDIQYDTENSVTNKSQVNVDYHYSEKNIVQLNHRYTRDVSGSSLEQLSLLTNVEINKDWQFIGRVTQDLQQKRSLETYAGFQYESCCWAVQFAFHRHINSYFEEPSNINENREEFDSGFMIRFIVKGLNKQGQIDTDNMLNSSIFGYKRPYFLNN